MKNTTVHYRFGKLPPVGKIIAIGALVFVAVLIAFPFFPGNFTTPEAAQSNARWLISLAGVFVGWVLFSPIFSLVCRYASDGKVRVVFVDFSALCDVVEGEYTNLAEAILEVRLEYDIKKIWGLFIFYDDQGRQLHKLMP